MIRVLEDSLILDFKSLILKDYDQGNFRTALVKVEEMVLWGQELSLNAFSILVKAVCASSYSIGTIVSLLKKMPKLTDQLDHETLNLLVQALRISKASTVLDFLLAKNLVPCLDTTILSIYQLCLASKFEKVVALKEIALRKHSSNSIFFHCALMKGFCKLGMVGEATDIFQNMILRGLFRGNETCNVLFQGYCQTNNLREVKELLDIIIRNNLRISISSYRNLVCLIMCMMSRVSSALSVKELLLKESNPIHLIIYNILIFYLFLTRNSLFVDALLDELQEKGLQVDGVTYDFLVYGYSQCKEVPHSLHYLTTMMSMEHKPSNRSIRIIISYLCGDGELGKAMELSQEMDSRGWIHGSIIQNAIVEGLLAQGKVHEAVRVLDRMVQKGPSRNSCWSSPDRPVF